MTWKGKILRGIEVENGNSDFVAVAASQTQMTVQHDEGGCAVLATLWKYHSEDRRYFIVAQCSRIVFVDGGLADKVGDQWVVRVAGDCNEAESFVCGTTAPLPPSEG